MKYINKKVIFNILFFSAVIIPYLLVDIYVLPSADDLSNIWELRYQGGHNIGGIINFVKYSYMNYQGVFFGKFLESSISPVYSSFNSIGLNITLIIILLLFVGTVARFIRCISDFQFKGDNTITYILALLTIMLCLNGRVKKELFFWFTGACDYTIPVICGFWGIILLLVTIKNKKRSKQTKRIYVVIASVLGFFASGGSLQIASYFCWLFLLMLGACIYKKQEVKKAAIVFGITLLGALLNVAAPGNYARKGSSYEGISLLRGGYYAAIAVFNELKYLLSSTYIPWVLLIIIIIVFIYMEPVQDKILNPIIVGMAVLGSWLISTFPVCYGYGDSSLASRGHETLGIYITIGLYILVISIVNWMKNNGLKLSKESIFVIALLSIINIGYLQNVSILKIPNIQCIMQVLSGDLKNYHDEWISVLEKIQEEEAVAVEVPISQKNYSAEYVVMRPGLSENPENWVNQALKLLFDKEKVQLLIQEDSKSGEGGI